MIDKEDAIRRLPLWRGPIEIAPLKGGLSNESFTVRDRADRFVVRFGSDYPFHQVSRAREVMTARAAAKAGFAPEVVHAEPGVMVSRYIDGVTYGEPEVRANIKPVAELIKGFHKETARHITGAGFMFWPFHVIRDYAHTLAAGGSRMAHALPGYLELSERLEAAMAPMPIVFGHHDLLPANFIHDGARLWLIDFEYAGFGTAMFDLAGIASNAGFDADQADELLNAYFDGPPAPEIRQSHAAMQCASLLREAMWSMVSELHLDTPGVDFVAYTAENLERLDGALAAYASAYGKV